MHLFLYLALAVIIYGLLADRTDRAVDRELQKRRADSSGLGLVEDFDVKPDLGPRSGRGLRLPHGRLADHQRGTTSVGKPNEPA